MPRETPNNTMQDLLLIRSDQDDGAWDLYAPWAQESEIASGEAPPLASGQASEIDGSWNRPNSD